MTKQYREAVIRPLGDSALIVQLGEGMSPVIHNKIRNLSILIQAHAFEGFVECVPAYQNLTVYYNPYIVHLSNQENRSLTPFQKVSAYINDLLLQLDKEASFEERTVTIPVLYGGECGPDLEYVASYHDLSVEEVIRIHSEGDYLVYMIGFAPGFPFIGGMDGQIATPRKETPRLAIDPGSVGIAGKQTGVYPLETPGGWQLIGRTPINLFLPEQSPPTLLQSGDKIQFEPISPEEYAHYKEAEK